MLPPNLTRHYYETLRAIAESDGLKTAPWYRLTAEQKTAVENDLEIFRRAILRAEDEQDLVASVNASATAAETPEPAPEPVAPTLKDCGCPGCAAVAALLEFIKQAERLEDSLSKGNASAAGLKAGPLTAEQRADLEKATREAINDWVAKGRPLVDLTAAGSWIPMSRLDLDVLGPSPFDLMRWGFLKQPSPQAFLRGIGTL